jgi:hypothetical protein
MRGFIKTLLNVRRVVFKSFQILGGNDKIVVFEENRCTTSAHYVKYKIKN